MDPLIQTLLQEAIGEWWESKDASVSERTFFLQIEDIPFNWNGRFLCPIQFLNKDRPPSSKYGNYTSEQIGSRQVDLYTQLGESEIRFRFVTCPAIFISKSNIRILLNSQRFVVMNSNILSACVLTSKRQKQNGGSSEDSCHTDGTGFMLAHKIFSD